jgi:L-malate glycosyltransferase
MKILLVVPWDQKTGGVSSVVGNLAGYLQSQGHEVIFFHPGKTIFLRRKVTKQGFQGFELRLLLPFKQSHTVLSTIAFLILFPIILYQLIHLIVTHQIQVINIHYPTECFSYFAICSRILAIVLISSVHGADVFPGGKPRVKYSRAIRFLLSASARIVTPSQAYQNDFLSVFPDLKEKTIYIHNGINLAELNRCSRDTIEREQKQYILCIAAHNEKKGIDILLHATKRLQEVEPLLQIALVGDGPLRGQLEGLALSLGVHERVEFLGWKGRAQVAELLHGCEIFVLPSRSEPFGIVILEALACKKPVVATTVGGIPEIIENGKNGILVEPDNPDTLAEALIALLKNPALRQAIARNGQMTVHKRFCCKNTGAAYEAVLHDLAFRATTDRTSVDGPDSLSPSKR